jgi:capsid protein
VALSINPRDDAEAAAARIKAGLSSPQMECGKVNTNWRDVLNDVAEIYAVAQQKGIPQEVVNNIMGVDSGDQLKAQQAAQESAGATVNAQKITGNNSNRSGLPVTGSQGSKL